MGTVVSFDVRPGPVSPAAVRVAISRACALLQRADAVFSLWKPESPMSRLRRGDIALAEAPPEVAEVLDLCEQVRDASGGWFDPWALPGGVDPTGLVKGWAAARALGPLRAAGVAGAMVNAGGDIALLGEPTPGSPWRIGIRHPDDPHRLVRVIATRSAVATSGTYERGEHLVDPRSGQSASPVAAATVVGPDLGWADGLATGLVVAGRPGLDAIEQLDGYSAMLVGRDGGVTVTGGFPPDVGEAPAGRTSGDG